MPLFAVVWTYTADSDVLATHRAAHGAFIKQLAAISTLVEAGAWTDGSGALLIVRADSAEEAEQAFASDPYVVQGIVTSADIREWAPVLGALA